MLLLQSSCCTDGQPLADTPQPALLEAPPTRRCGGVGLDIHSAADTNALAPVAARAKPLVYVPNSRSAGVSVIDPATYTVIRTFATGAVPQHVVPAHDLDRLWVLDNEAGTLTPIDPATGQEGGPIHVDDPYNMYFTPSLAARRSRPASIAAALSKVARPVSSRPET